MKTDQLHPDVAHWLENAINPFPDYPETPAGVPSHGRTQSANKNVQKILTVTAPSDPPNPDATWECTVWTMPFEPLLGFPLRGATLTPGEVQNPTSFPFVAGDPGVLLIVKAWKDVAPEPANPFSPSFNPALAEISGINLSDAWVGEGGMRLTNFGYEITDNTPELYRGGNMINWRKTSAASDMSLDITANGQLQTNFEMRAFPGFPRSQAEAFRIPGSTSTRFTKGTYVVGTFNRHKNDFELPRFLGASIAFSNADFINPVAALFIGGLPREGPPARGTAQWYQANFTYTHLDHSGSYCTGLQPQATFSLSCKAGMEILPNASSVLIDFAHPTTPYSSKMEDVYDQVVSVMPPSAPVTDNASGDFFKRMISIATPIISKMFPTAAPLINVAGNFAQKGVTALAERRQKKKAAKSTALTVRPKMSDAAIRVEINRLKKLL